MRLHVAAQIHTQLLHGGASQTSPLGSVRVIALVSWMRSSTLVMSCFCSMSKLKTGPHATVNGRPKLETWIIYCCYFLLSWQKTNCSNLFFTCSRRLYRYHYWMSALFHSWQELNGWSCCFLKPNIRCSIGIQSIAKILKRTSPLVATSWQIKGSKLFLGY